MNIEIYYTYSANIFIFMGVVHFIYIFFYFIPPYLFVLFFIFIDLKCMKYTSGIFRYLKYDALPVFNVFVNIDDLLQWILQPGPA